MSRSHCIRTAVLIVLAHAATAATLRAQAGPAPGDVAPGTLDDSTSPPTWTIEGDGSVDVNDVLVVLRNVVGLNQFAPVKSHADPPQGSYGTRFTDNGNGTVTDGQTGLIWLKDWGCGGQVDWVEGIAWASALADGQCGLTDGSSAGDWRLPTVDEWADDTTSRQDDSVLKPSCGMPYLPNTHGGGCWSDGDPFANVVSGSYWTGTTAADNPQNAWFVNLSTALVGSGGGYKGNTLRVVAVRGGS
jgi:hypothetical protein